MILRILAALLLINAAIILANVADRNDWFRSSEVYECRCSFDDGFVYVMADEFESGSYMVDTWIVEGQYSSSIRILRTALSDCNKVSYSDAQPGSPANIALAANRRAGAR